MANRFETPMPSVIGLTLTAFWIGLLIGVSFLATPAKFLAPSLTLPVALDVGRHTFSIFNKLEWLLAAMLLMVLLLRPRNSIAITCGVLVALVVALEATWLLPTLDQRVGMIIAGQHAPESNLHSLYIGIEVAKLLTLAVAAFVMARRISHVDALETVGAIPRTTLSSSFR